MENTNTQDQQRSSLFQEVYVARATGNVVDSELKLRTIGEGENQTSLLNFTLACNNYAPQGAEPTTSFIRVAAFGRDAENLAQYLTKGKPLTVRGRMELRPYQSKKYFDGDGKPATMIGAELRMEQNGFQFINGGRRQSAQAGDSAAQTAQAPAQEEAAASTGTAAKSTRRSRSRKAAGSQAASIVPGPASKVEQPGGPF